MNIEHVFAQALEQKLNAELICTVTTWKNRFVVITKTVWSMNPSRREVWKHTFFENLSAGVTKASARANNALKAFDNAFAGE
ncbi:hypothetical protein IANJMKHF_00181 [Klebsiella phage CPRSA]|nr:hypothetical protein IANJMKHF_00181 [Klebsiella phage CPRSA]